MRMRAKVLTVATAMVTTFALLPTFGATAAEPLEDGSYAVTVDEDTYTVEVVDGTPVIEDVEGVEFTFAFDEETGRVLDEFDVAVDGTTYEVEVDDDGTVEVTQDEAEEDETEGEKSGEDDGDSGDDGDSEDESEDVDDADDEIEALEEDDEEAEEDGEAHGELVSTVAQCAPGGKVAREAGLPNHGFFVSAAARGESVDFEVDDETHTANLTSLDGAEEFCVLADELVDAAEEEAGTDTAEVEDDQDDDGDGEARGRGKGRPNDAPGRSGDAPGRAKKGR